MEDNTTLTKRLIALIDTTGYKIMQVNGQRRFGPPPNWTGPPPARGSEVFVGKLPRDCYEDELIPVFSQVGRIYELRLMMDFSGSNRGYAFVTYTTPAEAYQAIRDLNNYEIRPHKRIGVVKSVDNCRLFIGGIPKNKSAFEIREELSNCVEGIVDVIVYPHFLDRSLNRGFAFVEFESHRSAAMARRRLIPGRIRLWDQEVLIDWAEPEPDVDDEIMQQVKVLYLRNLSLDTPQHKLQRIIEQHINGQVTRCKKIKDFAFVHFDTRDEAEEALQLLNGITIDGCQIEVKWAKPVNTELYRLQKTNKGHGKFNQSSELSQTLMLYKQHLAESTKMIESEIRKRCDTDTTDQSSSGYVGSTNTSEMTSSPAKTEPAPILPNPHEEIYMAPLKLAAICKRYGWSAPVYYFAQMPSGWWTAYVLVPNVSVGVPPVSAAPHRALAHAQAAHNMLTYMKNLRNVYGVVSPTQLQPAMYATPYQI